ncbi:hypothetical protein [Arhodomonas sp. SL1]|uniref:hypothetical protein n=1 Tax=Arhodomonas sp. SL1 TaxID=3425691 RepID=UPI003F882578
MNCTAKQSTGLCALVLGATLLVAPLHASAQDRLPDLEGTTYGLMLDDLGGQLEALESADASEREQALHEAALTLTEQNLVMVRMIDALHDKVNGLIEDQNDLVSSGQEKFQEIGSVYRENSRKEQRRRLWLR